MAFKMKGFSGFKQKSKAKKIMGQNTVDVETSPDGKAFTRGAVGREIDNLGASLGKGSVNQGDTVFIPPAYHGNIQTGPGVNTAADTGDAEYLTDEDYTLTETKGSKKRKKGPKSYDISGGYRNTKTKTSK